MASNEKTTPATEEPGFTFTAGRTKLMMPIIQHSTEIKVSGPLLMPYSSLQ